MMYDPKAMLVLTKRLVGEMKGKFSSTLDPDSRQYLKETLENLSSLSGDRQCVKVDLEFVTFIDQAMCQWIEEQISELYGNYSVSSTKMLNHFRQVKSDLDESVLDWARTAIFTD